MFRHLQIQHPLQLDLLMVLYRDTLQSLIQSNRSSVRCLWNAFSNTILEYNLIFRKFYANTISKWKEEWGKMERKRLRAHN